jgi:hypothetical protein
VGARREIESRSGAAVRSVRHCRRFCGPIALRRGDRCAKVYKEATQRSFREAVDSMVAMRAAHSRRGFESKLDS